MRKIQYQKLHFEHENLKTCGVLQWYISLQEMEGKLKIDVLIACENPGLFYDLCMSNMSDIYCKILAICGYWFLEPNSL
jgi:hypothetical protein